MLVVGDVLFAASTFFTHWMLPLMVDSNLSYLSFPKDMAEPRRMLEATPFYLSFLSQCIFKP
jgi:hypothetical protein